MKARLGCERLCILPRPSAMETHYYRSTLRVALAVLLGGALLEACATSIDVGYTQVSSGDSSPTDASRGTPNRHDADSVLVDVWQASPGMEPSKGQAGDDVSSDARARTDAGHVRTSLDARAPSVDADVSFDDAPPMFMPDASIDPQCSTWPWPYSSDDNNCGWCQLRCDTSRGYFCHEGHCVWW